MMLRLALSALLAFGPPTVEQAEAAFDAGDFDAAAAAYAAVYEDTGDIAFLFARGEAERLGGHCREALETYEAFIATKPKPEAIAFAEQRIELCRNELPEPPAEPEVTGVAPPAEPLPPAPAREPTARPWHRDPAGAALVGVGLAGMTTGVVLTAVAHASQTKAERATDVDTYGDRNDRAVVLSRASIPVLAVGGALLVAGIVRYALVARSRRSQAALGSLGPALRLRF
jgi:hypothetical protein